MKSIAELIDLTGRRALITGGAGHIGFAIAEALAELGSVVALADRDGDACRRRAGELTARGGGRAIALPFDLADEHATRAACKAAISELGGLDIFVHAAAFVGTTQVGGWSVPFERQSVEAWDAGMRVNLTSAFVIAQEARAALAASRHGSIILVSSIYGMVGSDAAVYGETGMNPDRVLAYSASKGGLLQVMRHLSALFAPDIRVNALSPGGVARNQPELFQQKYSARTPLKRMATEEDMKGAAAYLASDLSAYVTGHNLVVDGGWTAW